MAKNKRFCDTEIWQRPWFRRLSPKMKEAWRFLCDKCDHAGVWVIDMEAMSWHVGDEITIEEVLKDFGDKVLKHKNDRLFLTKFVRFQYGVLRPTNNAHSSVLKILAHEGLLEFINDSDVVSAPAQPLPSPCPGAQEKEKEKECIGSKKGGVGENKPDTPSHNSTRSFEARFRKDRPATIGFLRDSKMLSGQVQQNLAEIFSAFPTDEDFETFIGDIQNSKTYKSFDKQNKKHEADSSKRNYIRVSILKACGAIKEKNETKPI